MDRSMRMAGTCQVWYVRLVRLHAEYFGASVGYLGGKRRKPSEFMSEPKITANNATSGGCFRAKMTFPPNYPLYPPKMKFETPIFHPNGKSPGTRSIIQRLTSRQSTRAATSAFPSSTLPKKTNTATRKPASAGHPSFHPRLSFYRSSVCSGAQTMKVPPTSRPASSGERIRKSSRGRSGDVYETAWRMPGVRMHEWRNEWYLFAGVIGYGRRLSIHYEVLALYDYTTF